jgi:hypothetical protein
LLVESFSTLWVGGDIGYYEKLSLQSALASGKRVTLYSYEELKSVPEGILLSDASLILPKTHEVERIIEAKLFSGLANIFRYQLLQQMPTAWFDTDIVFLKREFPVSPYLFAYQDSKVINNAILSFPQGSDLGRIMTKQATTKRVLSRPRGTTGPRLLTKSVEALSLENYALPESSFYPLHYSEVWKLFDPGSLDILLNLTTDSYAIHLWNEMLKFTGYDLKLHRPPYGSYMEHLFLTFNCEMPELPPWPIPKYERWKDILSGPKENSANKSVVRRAIRTLKSNRTLRRLFNV